MARGALPFESLTAGKEDDFSYGCFLNCSEAQMVAGQKVEFMFERVLGVKMDGTPVIASGLKNGDGNENGSTTDANAKGDMDDTATTAVNHATSPQALLGGMCTSSIDLWLLYIRKRSRDAKRHALQHHMEPDTNQSQSQQNNQSQIPKLTSDGEELIRDWIIGAYETALSNGASFVYNNDIIWKKYLSYVKSWNIMNTTVSTNATSGTELTINHMLHTKQKALLRSIYQRIVTLPMTGLDSLWTEYEMYEKAQSEQLATALIAEHMPKYQHARSVYLERNRVFNIHELRIGKVATPPADCNESSKEDGGTANSNKEESSEIIEEMQLLSKWKKRCAYERTNPERLSNADLAVRIRQCFKDTICAFMRHVEVWHEWCMWELFNTGSGGGSAGTSVAAAAMTSTNAKATGKKRNVQYSIAVLTLAQMHIPDCTLLAYANVMILENQVGGNMGADEAIDIMTQFCDRAGNTLGYVLLQRLVRKYKGMKKGREIFATARRALRIRVEDMNDDFSNGADGIASDHPKVDSAMEDAAKSNVETGGQDAAIKSTNGTNEVKKKLVITRETFKAGEKTNIAAAKSKKYSDGGGGMMAKNGLITWHLYASHALIEHRINKLPQVAARVYELGLRKHRTFLATPQFVLQYCSLLFELGDEENLRALLTRAIAACEEDCGEQVDDTTGAGNSSNSAIMKKRDKQRPLWDMMLMFESIVSARSVDQTSLRDIEARRRQALYGPESEDVSGGSFLNETEVGIGMHKISLSDTLIRSEGYDVSSRIVNGLDRIVDMLEISGILGQESTTAISSLGSVWKDDGAGGLSDASFRRRKRLQTKRSVIRELSASGSDLLRNTALSAGITGATSGKLLSAKERLAQNAFQNQNMTVAAAVLSSPEWLRDMLMLLPATARNFRGAKAPPHMIEMALAALRDNPLPASRPSDSQIPDSNVMKRKRKMNDGDSSDEENVQMRGGYGNQFRNRQRAKLMSSNMNMTS